MLRWAKWGEIYHNLGHPCDMAESSGSWHMTLEHAIKVRILASQPALLPCYFQDSPLVVPTDRLFSL